MNQSPSDASPFFALPTRGHALLCLGVTALLFSLFMFVYSGADYLTGLRATHVRIDFDFEHQLPFVPELSVIYSSIYFMFLAVPFVLRTTPEIKYFAAVMASVMIIAGVCFLLLPAEVGFVVPASRGLIPAAFDVADRLNLTYNLCPSLHVTFSVICAEVFRRKQEKFGWPFHVWAAGIAISAWLTYQHHFVDLIGGYVLGLAATAVAHAKFLRSMDEGIMNEGNVH